MKRSALLLAGVFVTGCGLVGDSSPWNERIRNGGTGPFRMLTVEETGIEGAPPGRIASAFGTQSVNRDRLLAGRVAYTDSGCVATVYPALDPVPPPDPDLASGVVDPAQWGAPQIVRCDGTSDTFSITFSDVPLLVPEEPWEAGGLSEASLLTLEDGTVHLYYVAQGQIGLARASSVSGPFTRVSDTPILSWNTPGRSMNSPTVVRIPNGDYVLYFDDGAAIYAAISSDARAFALYDPVPATSEIEPVLNIAEDADPAELALIHPAALVAQTVSGRDVVRIYFESPSASRQAVAMAASFDGFTFERHNAPSFVLANLAYPTPRHHEPTGATLLTVTSTFTSSVAVQRNVMGAVAPSFVSFAATED